MTMKIVGIPSHAGALDPGTETAPAHLRKHGLVLEIRNLGLFVEDAGDVSLPPLPRHNIAPVRNWPGPRMVWEAIDSAANNWFAPNVFTLILGGDCSIVTGTGTALQRVVSSDLHLLVLDAHVDANRPDPAQCSGAAGMGLWFLTQGNLLWHSSAILEPSQITVFGCQERPSEPGGIRVVPRSELESSQDASAVRRVLDHLPRKAKLFVHFDVDVICQKDMPAAYAPSEWGLSISACKSILSELVSDPRVLGLEVTEFSVTRDPEGVHARSLAKMIAESLSVGATRRSTAALGVLQVRAQADEGDRGHR